MNIPLDCTLVVNKQNNLISCIVHTLRTGYLSVSRKMLARNVSEKKTHEIMLYHVTLLCLNMTIVMGYFFYIFVVGTEIQKIKLVSHSPLQEIKHYFSFLNTFIAVRCTKFHYLYSALRGPCHQRRKPIWKEKKNIYSSSFRHCLL